MTQDTDATERVVDHVWSQALDKIMKGSAPPPSRRLLGDDLDLIVPQTAAAALIGRNSAFAGMLYSSGYASARRNAYFLIRRLEMPADFFWQFDYWTEDRAFTTLKKVTSRIFASIMSKHKVGTLDIEAVDVENSRFEFSFGECAECFGLTASGPLCFFHAGLFAGILAAILDRELDAYESQCGGGAAGPCRFVIGKQDDREISQEQRRWLDNPSLGISMRGRVETSLANREDRALGGLVDVGYYQLLLSSSHLSNLSMIEEACFATGDAIGRDLAAVVSSNFEGDMPSKIRELYLRLRYVDAVVEARAAAVMVKVLEAPEALTPLPGTVLTSFLCGELQGLISELGDRPMRFESKEVGQEGLLLRFAPQV